MSASPRASVRLLAGFERRDGQSPAPSELVAAGIRGHGDRRQTPTAEFSEQRFVLSYGRPGDMEWSFRYGLGVQCHSDTSGFFSEILMPVCQQATPNERPQPCEQKRAAFHRHASRSRRRCRTRSSVSRRFFIPAQSVLDAKHTARVIACVDGVARLRIRVLSLFGLRERVRTDACPMCPSTSTYHVRGLSGLRSTDTSAAHRRPSRAEGIHPLQMLRIAVSFRGSGLVDRGVHDFDVLLEFLDGFVDHLAE